MTSGIKKVVLHFDHGKPVSLWDKNWAVTIANIKWNGLPAYIVAIKARKPQKKKAVRK